MVLAAVLGRMAYVVLLGVSRRQAGVLTLRSSPMVAWRWPANLLQPMGGLNGNGDLGCALLRHRLRDGHVDCHRLGDEEEVNRRPHRTTATKERMPIGKRVVNALGQSGTVRAHLNNSMVLVEYDSFPKWGRAYENSLRLK